MASTRDGPRGASSRNQEGSRLAGTHRLDRHRARPGPCLDVSPGM